MNALIAKLGQDDAEYAVETFAQRFGLSPESATEILEDVVLNGGLDQSFDDVMEEACEGMTEARAYDEEMAFEMN